MIVIRPIATYLAPGTGHPAPGDISSNSFPSLYENQIIQFKFEIIMNSIPKKPVYEN
jgi:hypothetical protein